jgi:hypothetical protein
MPNECGECGAKLRNDQTECAYCGAAIYDADEKLLAELMALARKYNEALLRANRIEVEKCLADEHQTRLTDAGVEHIWAKKTILENANGDKNFISYNIHDAELLERSNEKAVIGCIQTVTRRDHFEEGEFDPYIERGTISFVHRNGRWLIASQDTVSIDENGNVIE